MIERVRLAGSIAIHALLALLLASIHHAKDEPGAPPRLELVDVVISPAPPSVAPASPSHGAAGVAPAPRHARRMAMPRTAELGELRIEPVGDPIAGGEGEGRGRGLGQGDGRGLAGLLAAAPSVPAPPPPPPAPRISKARPARLIYPSRQTQVDEDRLFVADVIVDADGYVVGARLARGSGGPRDVEAGAAVWRFRYEPALDDDGVPTRSAVHQTFAVAW